MLQLRVAVIHHLLHVTEVLIPLIISVMAPVAERQLDTVCKYQKLLTGTPS